MTSDLKVAKFGPPLNFFLATSLGGTATFVADRLNCQQNFKIKTNVNACEDV